MENNQAITDIKVMKIVVSKDSTGNLISNILPEAVLKRYTTKQIEDSIVNINGFNVLHCLTGKNEKGEISIVDVAVMPG